MTWLKLDDKFPRHPKISGLSDAAFRLHVAALAHCAEYETDGVLLAHIVETMTRHTAAVRKAAIQELVAGWLWAPKADGWVLHDFTEWNPSKAELEAKRKAAKERMNAARSRSVRANEERTSDVSSPNRDWENTGTGRVSGVVSSPDPDPEPTNHRANPPTPVKPDGESGYDLAERVWLELWQAKFKRKFVRTWGGGDKGQDRILQTIGHHANEQAEPERWMRHFVREYLRDTDRWLMDNGHPLAGLVARLNKYGEPKGAPRSGVRPMASQMPAEPPPVLLDMAELSKRSAALAKLGKATG